MSDNSKNTQLPDGHPVRVYFQENDLIHQLLEELLAINSNEDLPKFTNVFNQLQTIKIRLLARNKTKKWKLKKSIIRTFFIRLEEF
jgi:DUF438 domain-containing protein